MTAAIRLCLLALLVAIAGCIEVRVVPMPRAAVTYVASPTGDDSTGAVCTEGTPCSVRRGLITMSCANNDVLELLDGVYRGDAAMMQPPTSKAGTDNLHRCTVRARNDGQVFIDGQFARVPFITAGNHWWKFEGFDAGNSFSPFFGVYSNNSNFPTSNLILRRICLSNASYTAPANTHNVHVFHPDLTSNSLFEDMCMFGTGRTTMTEYGVGAGNVYRRMWLRYEGNPPSDSGSEESPGINSVHQMCPATPVVQYAYDSASATSIYENIITIHDPEQFNTSTWNAWSDCDTSVPYKPAAGRRDPSTGAFRFRGWISYGYDNFTAEGKTAQHSNGISWMDDHLGRTSIVDYFLDGRSQAKGYNFWLECAGCASTSADRLTSIRNSGVPASAFNTFGSGVPTNANECSASSTATGASLGGCPSFYTGTSPGTGARNCFEYSGMTLTATPLWPWRMDDRIKAALTRARNASLGGTSLAGVAGSGYAAATVTSEIVARYGAIPPACLRAGAGPTPNPPAGLNLTQLWQYIWTPLAGVRG